MTVRRAAGRQPIFLAALCVTIAVLLLSAASSDARQPRRYWGAWVGSQLTGTEAPWDMKALRRFHSAAGRGLSLVQFSSPFAECEGSGCAKYRFPTSEMEKIRRHGAIPFLSWGSAALSGGSEEPAFQLSDLISGRYDAYIRRFARQARDWAHPFFLRFDWEMNGNWFAWGAGANGNRPGEYVAAWRHVHDIFSAVGADDVTWVWCPYARDEPLRRYYPGDRYVDWTGLDGFDWGPGSPEPAPRMSFGQIFGAPYRQIGSFAADKPMILAEIASSGKGAAKARWIREMFAALRGGFPRIRALVWFDKIDRSAYWPIEGSASARRAFRRGLRSGYTSNAFSRLRDGKIKPPR